MAAAMSKVSALELAGHLKTVTADIASVENTKDNRLVYIRKGTGLSFKGIKNNGCLNVYPEIGLESIHSMSKETLALEMTFAFFLCDNKPPAHLGVEEFVAHVKALRESFAEEYTRH